MPRAPWASANARAALIAPDREELVDFKFAVAFIVAQLRPQPAELRALSGRISHAVGYARKTGQLKFDLNGKIQFCELMSWGCSRAEWRTALSPFQSLNPVGANVALQPFESSGGGRTVPITPDEKDAALCDAFRRIHELEVIVAAQEAELVALRPLELKRQRRTLQASVAGKKGGRGRAR